MTPGSTFNVSPFFLFLAASSHSTTSPKSLFHLLVSHHMPTRYYSLFSSYSRRSFRPTQKKGKVSKMYREHEEKSGNFRHEAKINPWNSNEGSNPTRWERSKKDSIRYAARCNARNNLLIIARPLRNSMEFLTMTGEKFWEALEELGTRPAAIANAIAGVRRWSGPIGQFRNKFRSKFNLDDRSIFFNYFACRVKLAILGTSSYPNAAIYCS